MGVAFGCTGPICPSPSAVERQDPCRNHKSYREVISKMKPPVIPFVPLILKGESSQIMPLIHIFHARVLTLSPLPAQL